MSVALDVDGKPFRKRVCDRRAHTVQTARISVLTAVELRTRVQLRENDFHAADFEFGVLVYGDTSAVVADPCHVIFEKFDRNGVAETVCDFVDAVVDDFPKNVMHAFRARGTDVHTRTFSDRVKPFEDPDITCFVFVICHMYSLCQISNYRKHAAPTTVKNIPRARDARCVRKTNIIDYTTTSSAIKVFETYFSTIYEYNLH